MTSELLMILSLLLVTVVLFAVGRPRMDAVALIMMTLLPFTGVISMNDALAGLSDPNIVLIAALFVVGEGLVPTVLVAALCGVGIGLVSSLLGVAGGELIIPVFILLFGVDVKLAGSMAMLIGLPTIAVGLTRHFGAGTLLRRAPVWRGTILPLGAGSVVGAVLGAMALGLVPGQALKVGLGVILIWSARGVFRHLPQPGGTR